MKKSCLIVGIIGALFAGGIGLFAIIFYSVFALTSGIVESADNFLEQVGRGNIVEARECLSDEFRKATSDDQLDDFVVKTSLADFLSVNWNNRSVRNGLGELEGVVKTKSGATFPIHVGLVQEKGDWKLLSIEKKAVGAVETNIVSSIPEVEEANAIVKSLTNEFGKAILDKDFTKFHGETAREFQTEIPLEKFNELFSVFIEKQVDLSLIDPVQPIFESDPSITAAGVLNLQGFFPGDPRVIFDYELVKHQTEWQIVGINIRIRPQETVVDDAEAEKEAEKDAK